MTPTIILEDGQIAGGLSIYMRCMDVPLQATLYSMNT